MPQRGHVFKGQDASASNDPRRLPALRRCLGCGQMFPSRHAGNRICERCADKMKPGNG